MSSLIIKDIVYGEFEITEPVLIELINSKPVQRLKNIWQHGLPKKYYYMPTFTRYDHSLGVMLLLRKLNVSLEEQIAGLLHDVSHTAFSHVADYFYGTMGKDDYQDSILDEFLLQTEIPQILKKYSLNVENILSSEKYTLLDRPVPSLCADRYDYAIREIYMMKSKTDAANLTNSLTTKNQEMVFKDYDSANLFSNYFLEFQKTHWGEPGDMYRYLFFANLLKYAIDKKVILETDFRKDDYYIINKLENSKDIFILNALEKVKTKFKFKIVESEEDHLLVNKFRYVDAKYFDNNRQIKKVSETNLKFKRDLEIAKLIHEKGYKIKLLN